MSKKVRSVPEELADAEDEHPTVLSSQLVVAVLSLEPMQRTSLAAVIAGSLVLVP
ncbi:MAG TPA: hypothetical protein VF403_12290 [Kofleriaceae bacterium]